MSARELEDKVKENLWLTEGEGRGTEAWQSLRIDFPRDLPRLIMPLFECRGAEAIKITNCQFDSTAYQLLLVCLCLAPAINLQCSP